MLRPATIFIYKARRGVEDAIILFTNNLYLHLDITKSYVRTLIIDFSSAFYTIQPILFSIYTNDCISTCNNIPIIKYDDDTSIKALRTTNNNLANYKNEVLKFVDWRDSYFLKLNVKQKYF